MKSEERIQLYKEALAKFGLQSQMTMVVEETGELLNALAKYRRGRANKDDVMTELADVAIMVEQMACHFGIESFTAEKERKLNRLKERLWNH